MSVIIVVLNIPAEVDDFAIINVHIKPDDAVREIDELTQVYDVVKAHWNLEVGLSADLLH
jgi:hypothetical protein